MGRATPYEMRIAMFEGAQSFDAVLRRDAKPSLFRFETKAKEREFVYESDYDGNGVVYWVGTKYGTEKEWQNPSKRGLIRVDSSGWGRGSVDAMVANNACFSWSKSRE